MRECNFCHISQPLTEFNRAAHLRDGLGYKCKSCVRAWSLNYRKANAAIIRIKKAAYQLAHPEQRRAGEIRYYNRHRKRCGICVARRVSVRRRIDPMFRQKKIDLCRAHYLKRYGSPAGLAALFDSQLGRCANPACAKSLKEGCHVDHIMPVARGGSNDLRNLQFLCPSCNHRKSDRHPDEFSHVEIFNGPVN